MVVKVVNIHQGVKKYCHLKGKVHYMEKGPKIPQKIKALGIKENTFSYVLAINYPLVSACYQQIF